jgi:hypothetical protein
MGRGQRHSSSDIMGNGAPGAGAPGGVTDSGGTGYSGNDGIVVVYAFR